MVCPKCGRELLDDSAFCPECGERIVKSESIQTMKKSVFKSLMKPLKELVAPLPEEDAKAVIYSIFINAIIGMIVGAILILLFDEYFLHIPILELMKGVIFKK